MVFHPCNFRISLQLCAPSCGGGAVYAPFGRVLVYSMGVAAVHDSAVPVLLRSCGAGGAAVRQPICRSGSVCAFEFPFACGALVCADDAVVIDTSNMDIEQVVLTIKNVIQSKI